MAGDPEAFAQIARLLEEPALRVGQIEDVQQAIDAKFQHLVDGIIAEASASDDVHDRDSGLAFVQARVRFLEPLLRDDQRDQLLQALARRITSW